jgi:XTP/dITP diphosphohydrolase
MELVFATNNKHKLEELQYLLPSSIKLLSLADIGCNEELPETKDTIEGNAAQKAFYVYNKYHINCFADDTGLEVEALNGAPGVFSARYAGEHKNANDNIDKLLNELSKFNNRNALFKTIISLVVNGNENQFEGIVNGTILTESYGNQGFGYDSVFAPLIYKNAVNDKSISFAEMELSEKNKISHRAVAVKKLLDYLLEKPL